MTTTTNFDGFAESYDASLSAALASTGEDKSYFARGRVAWLAGSSPVESAERAVAAAAQSVMRAGARPG